MHLKIDVFEKRIQVFVTGSCTNMVANAMLPCLLLFVSRILFPRALVGRSSPFLCVLHFHWLNLRALTSPLLSSPLAAFFAVACRSGPCCVAFSSQPLADSPCVHPAPSMGGARPQAQHPPH
ncbi:hypothetical protein FKM82_009166 [Ascaphus truei]